jgi:predicted metal-dependent hydrolase
VTTRSTRGPVERPVAGGPGAPPLWLPDEPFPPYRFVPGQAPHPLMPGGYAHGLRVTPPPFRAAERWRENRAYLRGLDLFNRGWWWEAHEAWESYWHVVEGRDAVQHDLFKALIQLAACALQRERGSDPGAARLLFSAVRLLEGLQRETGGARLCGLDLDRLVGNAHEFLAEPTDDRSPGVHGFYLRPE